MVLIFRVRCAGFGWGDFLFLGFVRLCGFCSGFCVFRDGLDVLVLGAVSCLRLGLVFT